MKNHRLSRLIGYLLSDASVKTKKVKDRKITQKELSIEAADFNIVEDFSKLCSEFVDRDVGKITSRHRSEKWRKTHMFSCKINKEKSRLLFSILPTYLKQDERCRIPDFVYENKQNMINFLQAFTNSEGSVRLRVMRNKQYWQFQRYIKLSSKNPVILDGLQKVLLTLGIDCRKAPKKTPSAIIIQNKKAIAIFNGLIGFMSGVKVSNNGIWKGIEKQEILKRVLKSMQMNRGELQNFDDEKSVYEFLK